jgi:DNA-binding FadR family transcriptional regulator
MAQAARSPRTVIMVMLMHLAWQAKGQPFPFTNEALKKYGVSRNVKRKVLAALEAEGLIKVERSRTRSPIVTVTNCTVSG